MSPKLPVAALLLLLLLPLASEGQRQILGDITEQRISQVYDEDVRDDTLYRRPPIYLIVASRIVRPSTVYQVRSLVQAYAKPGWRREEKHYSSRVFQVWVSLLKEAKPMRIRAALSRDGVEVYGDHVNMNPDEARTILLQVRDVANHFMVQEFK